MTKLDSLNLILPHTRMNERNKKREEEKSKSDQDPSISIYIWCVCSMRLLSSLNHGNGPEFDCLLANSCLMTLKMKAVLFLCFQFKAESKPS